MGLGTVPPEAWDREHSDHEWWVNGRGWCYDPDCADHRYRQPGQPEPNGGLSPRARRELDFLSRIEGPQRAEAVLVAHQRRDNGGPCLCGWNELGKSHPGHQAAVLREAGLLNEASATP